MGENSRSGASGWFWKPGLVAAAVAAGASTTLFVASQPPRYALPPPPPVRPTQQQPIQPAFAQNPPGAFQDIRLVGGALSPIDQALQVVGEARQAYEKVQDYTCVFVKREVLRGQMQPENVIAMKVRAKPFSVHLKWQSPKSMEGQEGCYVAGKNNGMIRAKSAGLLGAVGFVSLETKDPRVLANSRHSLTEAGMGNLIERLAKRWEEEKALNRTVVRVAEYEFARRRCTRIETIHPNSQPGQFYAYRHIIYFDQETKMPIRAEAYDWPKQGGPPGGDLTECYSYVNLKFNVGLTDNDFNY